MKRILLLVEGQTEEAFVNKLIKPRYASADIRPIIVQTSASHKGGVTSYAKVRPQIIKLCNDTDAHVSTMFDLYALPNDFPGKNDASWQSLRNGIKKATLVEQSLEKDINRLNFIPNIIVHEFEALLFAQPDYFEKWTDDPSAIKKLLAIRNNKNPEDINDSPQTAPSKQIMAVMRTYQKTLHGPLIAEAIGLDTMRKNCPHFNSWLGKLENIINRKKTSKS